MDKISSFRDAWFRNVYDTLYPELYVYVHSFTSEEDVQDIVQEAFFKLLDSGRLEKVNNIRAYLFSCVRNLLFDRMRNSRNRDRILREMSENHFKGPDRNDEEGIIVRESYFA